jgi:hypothetical protein
MPAHSKNTGLQPPRVPRAEDVGAVWFLELELATGDGDIEAARAAQMELQRLGWEVRRRPRSVGGVDR